MEIRIFSGRETAFLAWCYGETMRMDGGERFDTTAEELLSNWQELTSEELAPDFAIFVRGVHAAQ